MIRVLIADDHQLVIDGLTRIFNESRDEIEIVGSARNGDDALQLLSRASVDVVILDIGMPGMDGAAALRCIVNEYPNVKVLMLTMYKDADRIRMMVQNGAKGYLLKNRSGKEVVRAIKKLHSGEYYFPGEIKDTVFEADIPKEHLDKETKRLAFTEKEEEIITMLAQGDQVKTIATKLLISPKTVEAHKTNLMRKIGARNVQDVVRYAVKNGYCPD